ncbi:AraC family transcriptional regulator [Ramlibacter albus]|uniref:Helix-turn-helix transcriptional regulator n=1 Tax=Ramlibacter albus TaxID=2079448 RepID=A0A923M9F3_9BURK|nr:helix-turn-helix transcriptional regulator [Ramlibacter albus]MBC5766111.1 helix-turn-helix transcriptional regulator [Ramlibacter albus]
MRRPAPLKPLPLGDVDPYRPDTARPVRVRSRAMPADTHFEPHQHAWAQLAYCASGVVQVSDERSTYIVPPSRAVWIAPGALHSVHVLEDAEFRTLYMDASVTPEGWASARVIRVSPLLRELVHSLDDAMPGSPREAMLTALVLDELKAASTQALGVPLPDAQGGDKRLRTVCEGVLRSPGERATLAEWASHAGASERTLARLFRDELGMTYPQWRQQAVLAHALPLLARGMPVSQVAAACAYSSDSAFTAMFKSAMGQPPSEFRTR